MTIEAPPVDYITQRLTPYAFTILVRLEFAIVDGGVSAFSVVDLEAVDGLLDKLIVWVNADFFDSVPAYGTTALDRSTEFLPFINKEYATTHLSG